MDPSEIQAKAYIRQILKKYTQEKDDILVGLATQAEQQISVVDADTERIPKMFERNKMLLNKESTYLQVEEDAIEAPK